MSESTIYEFDNIKTIKGFPELHWTGKRPYRSTEYFPAQLKERYGAEKNGWINKIFWGDNLQVMSHMLKEYRGKIDLIYIDPPFDSKADYKKKIELKGKKILNDNNSFEEKQYSDIWTNDEYLQFMYERLILLREVLSENGIICLHCDWHKGAYIRILMDTIFGVENYINEIIWKYDSGGIPEYFFSQKHDNIFVYTKGNAKDNKYIFNKKEASFPRNICQSCGQIMDKWNNLKKEIDEDGRIYRTIKSNGKIYKYYDDEPILLSDVWNDISHIQQKDPQRLDYPTQKPEELIERFVKVFSNENSIIFDCFMGSGTTQAVAMKLGRKFIGADINLGAIQTTTKRLINIAEELKDDENKHTGFEVYNVNNYDFFRNPIEAKDLIIDALQIQKFENSNIFDGELDGRMIKIMPVNRIATKADLEELKANLPYRKYDIRKEENPLEAVEKITFVCMGHEPSLKAEFEKEVSPYKIDIEILDILRDKKELQLKRDSDAVIEINDGYLEIKEFYPMNLLQKLSFQKEQVEDWRELVESIMIDWNYDGAVMEPSIMDIPDKKELVEGRYKIPEDAGKIRIKITDLLSESLEVEV